MYIVIGLQIVIFIFLIVHQKQLTDLKKQTNGLQERYNKEDYDAFFESLRECEEETERKSEKEFIGPVQYLREEGMYGSDCIYEDIKVYPKFMKYKRSDSDELDYGIVVVEKSSDKE